ncbi:MAG: nodulation protein NfeD [Methylococcaceae bacterium]|nr:nodulation protein NfeD [Methylococcaceae bacterium]
MVIQFIRFSCVLMILLTAANSLRGEEKAVSRPPRPGLALQIDIDGAIGPATTDYVVRAIDKAAERSADLIILRLDTPGGLDSAMRDIIKKILASPVPVVAYVAPGGARAASAGTYILYASHIAAMAPGTNLGAATPVQIGGVGDLEKEKNKEDGKERDDSDRGKENVSGNAMSHKIINDAVAYIRGLARMRGRNQEWAEKAVREAASLPAEEARELDVIDLVATDSGELLRLLNNRKVTVSGNEITLQTKGMELQRIEPDWRNELLAAITDPNVAYILFLIGIYGLIFEFSSPGAVLPGTVGAICLLLALFAFQVLPVNYAGLALILLGIALMVAEAFVPSVGVLGIGGVVAFVIGSIILMEPEGQGYGINPAIVGAFALCGALFFIVALGMLIRSRRKRVVSGREALVGGLGTALNDFERLGTIRIHSENWKARTDIPLKKGEGVRVTGMEGLVLSVTRDESGEEP